MKKLSLFVLLFFSFNLHAEVINVETKGNLKSEKPLTCVDITTYDISKHTPADILIGSKKCIDKKDYLNASRLYQSALLYGLFDIARVKDKTAHQGIKVLIIKYAQGLSKEQMKTVDKILINSKKTIFKYLNKPDYYPDYMINHGIQAINGSKSGLIKNFKPEREWANIRARYKRSKTSKKQPNSQLLKLEKDCSSDDPNACFNLAHIYAIGIGVKKNLPVSYILYKRACSLNLSEACSFLIRVHKSGCDNGSKKACDNLKELEVKQSVSKRITTEKKKITKDKGFGKKDIDRACLNQDKPPKDGMQFDGKKADAKIMQLKAGKYKYNGGHLLLFRNNHYILQLPKDRDGVHGTDGPDLLASGIVGGCTKEQLSEAIQNNNLKERSFELIKRYIK